MPKSKTTTPVGDGDSRQKKAFFAYFGKKFDIEKNGQCAVIKESAVKNGKSNSTIEDCSIVLLDEPKKSVIVEKRNTPRPTNNSFIKYDPFY